MANNSLLSLKTKDNSELKPVSLDTIVQDAVELAGVYADGKDIEIKVETKSDIEVLADSEKLTAVIINLIKNAVDKNLLRKDENMSIYIYISLENLIDESLIRLYSCLTNKVTDKIIKNYDVEFIYNLI